MGKQIVNPSFIFFDSYEDHILKTRQSLFKELNYISPVFKREAVLILENKIKAGNNTPLLGELFPWIISDLINANKNTTQDVSVGWLAIYLYTLFLDEHLDDPRPINPNKFLTGSLLAKTGILTLSKFTNNSPYEKYVEKAFSYSAKNEHLDVQNQTKNIDLGIKEKYSKGKNYIVLACAGALASQNCKYGKFITQFTETLLLTLQYLDDIADFVEDFNSANYTVILNDAFKENPRFSTLLNNMSRKELLMELIVSGALERSLTKIISYLNQSLLLISRTKTDQNRPSVEFIYGILFHCKDLHNLIKMNRPYFETYSTFKKSEFLDKVETNLTIIAQST